MKIGIITFWQSQDNYGQILQCFATQFYLKSQGHKPFLIRYDFVNRPSIKNTPPWKNVLKIALIVPYIRSFLSSYKLKLSLNKIEIKNRERRFDEFKNKYLTQSEFVYKTLKQLQDNPPEADCYITGSDQVWAQLISNKENRVFFLDFGTENIRKISYAASFARSYYPEELKIELRNLLEKFTAISVREKEGVDICNSVLPHKAALVLDPTLLLTNDVYHRFIHKINKRNYKYAFVYSINITSPNELKWNELKKYTDKKSIQIIVTPASGVVPGKELFKNTTYSYATIEGWLTNIYYSEFTITTSFHGVVFCILLQKNFAFMPLTNSFKRGNNRIFSLLEDLNLLNKIISNENPINKAIENPINWNYINKRLSDLRLISNLFLKNSLN